MNDNDITYIMDNYRRALGGAGFRPQDDERAVFTHPAGGRVMFAATTVVATVEAAGGFKALVLPLDNEGPALIHGLRRNNRDEALASVLWKDAWAFAVLAAYGRAKEGTAYYC